MKELVQIERRLRNIEEMLEVSDLMTLEEACVFLGVTKKTIQNNMNGRLQGTFCRNKLGKPMFYRSKLI